MIYILKIIWWDIKTRDYWLTIIGQILNLLPGTSGNLIRGYFWGRRLKVCGIDCRINKNIKIIHPENVRFGNKVWINLNCIISAGSEVEIGNNVLIGPDVKIWSINHKTNRLDIPIMDQGWSTSKVTIGNDVWIASNAILLPGANIPDGVVIGAHSLVTSRDKIESYSIYGGNPIKKIKERG